MSILSLFYIPVPSRVHSFAPDRVSGSLGFLFLSVGFETGNAPRSVRSGRFLAAGPDRDTASGSLAHPSLWTLTGRRNGELGFFD